MSHDPTPPGPSASAGEAVFLQLAQSKIDRTTTRIIAVLPSEIPGIPTVRIASTCDLKPLLCELCDLACLQSEPPPVYLDAVVLNRCDLLDLHILIRSKNILYIVQLRSIGAAGVAFKFGDCSCMSLRSFLESRLIPKVSFDIRGLSRVLFRRYGIELGGIQDLQLMELASRDPERNNYSLCELTTCIDRDIPDANAIKQRWMKPEWAYNAEAPRGYVSRIELLPWLWDVYRERLDGPGQAFWRFQAKDYARELVMLSKRDKENCIYSMAGPMMWECPETRMPAMLEWNDRQEADKVRVG